MSQTRTFPQTRLGRKTKIAGVVTALLAFLTTMGAAPSIASWSATATAASTVPSAAVMVAQSGLAGLGTTFQHDATERIGSFTLTNSGSVRGDVVFTVSATGELAAAIDVYVWSARSADACTTSPMPANAAKGTWAAFPTVTSHNLIARASTTYCVRSVVADSDAVASASGTQSVVVSATAQITAGGWTASAQASTTFSTLAMYPLGTPPGAANQNNWLAIQPVGLPGKCLDVMNWSTSPGAVVAGWTCTGQGNQRFEISPNSDGLSSIRAKSSAELFLGYAGGNSVLTTPGSNTTWRIERIGSTSYQFVHASTGLCLTTNSAAQNALTSCTGSPSQQYTMTRDPLTCLASGTSLSLQFGSSPTNRAYTVQNRIGSGQWTNVYTTSPNTASTFAVPRAGFLPGDAALDVRVIDSAGNVLYSGLTVTTAGANIACGSGFL